MPGASAGSVRALADASRVRWGDLGKRAASAAVLAPLAVLCIWQGGAPFAVLTAVAMAGLAWEWVQLCGARFGGLPGLVVPIVLLAAIAAMAAGFPLAAVAVLVAGGALAFVAAGSGAAAARLAAGVPYFGLAGLALLWLRHDPLLGFRSVLFVVLIVWGSDIGAYMVGRLVGGKLLAPAISPGKTWSGAVGGLLAAVLAGLACAASFDAVGLPVGRTALVAAGLSVVSQAGDLLESWIKRRFGVKDSGRLIPGHGGLLDRLDGLLAAAPVAALLALAAGPGVVLWR